MTSTQPRTAILPDHLSIDADKPTLSVLDHLCCYQVSGDDAATFLQGQFSNDINAVDETHGQFSAYCTPKGRMLATFFICQRAQHYYLITSADIASDTIKRLQMYIMRSQVTITAAPETVLLGVSGNTGEDLNTLLQALNVTAPSEAYQASSNDDCICLTLPGTTMRHLLIGDQSLLQTTAQFDSSQLHFYTHTYWQWLDILAGMPIVTSPVQEAFVPQMANLELIDGVSFSKGCYPGQEVVARLHYLGNANRRMFRLEWSSDTTLHAGDDVFTSGTEQAVGKFLSVVNVKDNQFTGLAVLRIEASNNGQLTTRPEQGDTIKIIDLPYLVPTEPKEK